MADNETEVIIVGGGPVGLTLACDLSNRGVKTILLERNKTTSVIAKAFALNSRSMEHFRRIGVQENIENASLPRDAPINVGLYSSVLNSSVMIKKTFESWGNIADGKIEKGYPFFEEGASPVVPMFCPQSSSEPTLKDHIEKTSDCVTLLYGHQATSISQDDNGVVVEAVTDGEQEKKTFKARYVVACDGGSSPSRKLLKAHMFGLFVVARAVSIMFHSPQIYERIKNESKVGMGFVFNPKLNATFIVANDKGGLVTHVLLPSTASDEEVKQFEQNPEETVKAVLGCDSLPFTILGSSAYNMHALVSTTFRVGRVLFAGDSAHQWLPAGGLGLNTGVSDAGDLAWKLEAVVKGYGGANLLDSFEEERRPLVDSTRQFAYYLGGNLLGNTQRFFALFSLPGIQNIVSWLVINFGINRVFDSNLLTLGFQYSNSSIIMHEYDKDGNIVTPASYRERRYPALPGCRAPHVVLPDHDSILDLFGKGFVLLIINGQDTDLKSLVEEFQQRKIPLQKFSFQDIPSLQAAYDRKYFLIRPDGIICWRSDSQPSKVESKKMVTTVIGDGNRKRLPMPIIQFGRSSTSHGSAFISDLLARFSIEMLLINYGHFSQIASWLISLGLFLTVRALHTKPLQQFVQHTSRHSAVVLRKFGDASSALEINNRHTGSFGPHDIVIRVFAVSINPIDIKMRAGYAQSLLAKFLPSSRKSLFPLILGRDCSGEVVAIGDEVTKFLPGDKVFTALPITQQGTYSQLVSVDESYVSMKPTNIDYKEAASLPMVACSVWSALVNNAGLTRYNTRGKKVLIHDGTGGCGSFALQVLKAWGAEVTVTCATQNIHFAHGLGADKVIDNTAGDLSIELNGYDIVLDPVGGDYEQKSISVLKLFGGAKYISLISPKISLGQKFGLFVGGFLFSWLYRFKVFVNRLFFGRSFYYTNTVFDSDYLDAVCEMVEKGEIRPLIEAVYPMDEIVAAHKHIEAEHTRGKIVVTIP